MPRTSRSLVVLLVLALYGSVSVCGNGLHGWLDLSHACCHEDHPGHGGATAEEPFPLALTWISSRADSRIDADACPICQFHIQGQLTTPPIAARWFESVSTTCPLLSGRLAAAELAMAHSPRAPPEA